MIRVLRLAYIYKTQLEQTTLVHIQIKSQINTQSYDILRGRKPWAPPCGGLTSQSAVPPQTDFPSSTLSRAQLLLSLRRFLANHKTAQGLCKSYWMHLQIDGSLKIDRWLSRQIEHRRQKHKHAPCSEQRNQYLTASNFSTFFIYICKSLFTKLLQN